MPRVEYKSVTSAIRWCVFSEAANGCCCCCCQSILLRSAKAGAPRAVHSQQGSLQGLPMR